MHGLFKTRSTQVCKYDVGFYVSVYVCMSHACMHVGIYASLYVSTYVSVTLHSPKSETLNPRR